jgi:hypothetical protein
MVSTSPSSRRALGVAGAVLAGGISAVCFGLALLKADTMFVFLIYLSAIPLFIAGLSGGSVAAVIASAAGLVGLFSTFPSNYAILYFIVSACPSLVLTVLSLRHRIGADQKIYWYPEGHLLTATSLYPCALFLMAVMMTAGHQGGLLAMTTEIFNETADQVSKQFNPDQAVVIHMILERSAKIVPAVLGCSWMFLVIISLVLAQMLLNQQKWNIRADFSLNELHIPNWLIFAVAMTGLAGASFPEPYDYIGLNLGIILGVPFFFVGLAIIHAYANLQKSPLWLVIPFYVLLSLFPALVVFVALLGAVDQWVNFRRHFARRVNKSV